MIPAEIKSRSHTRLSHPGTPKANYLWQQWISLWVILSILYFSHDSEGGRVERRMLLTQWCSHRYTMLVVASKSLNELQCLEQYALLLPHCPHTHGCNSGFTQPGPHRYLSHLPIHYQLKMLCTLESFLFPLGQSPVYSVFSRTDQYCLIHVLLLIW